MEFQNGTCIAIKGLHLPGNGRAVLGSALMEIENKKEK